MCRGNLVCVSLLNVTFKPTRTVEELPIAQSPLTSLPFRPSLDPTNPRSEGVLVRYAMSAMHSAQRVITFQGSCAAPAVIIQVEVSETVTRGPQLDQPREYAFRLRV